MEDSTFLGICPFLPGYPLYCHIVVHSPPGSSVHGILQARILEWVAISCSKLFIIVSYNPLYFCIVCCSLSFFISNFVDLIPLFFFLMSLAKGLSIIYLLKESAFSFINLYYCSFLFFFIYFCSDLYDCFPSTNFGLFFFCSFPVVLGVKLGCLVDVFLVSSGRIYCYKLPF